MSRFRITTFISIMVLTIALVCFSTSHMLVQAQERPTSILTLDGRRLFEVSETEQFSAENRATEANVILRQAVRSSEPVKVEIVESNQLPVIRVNSRHLLTVTQEDTPTGRSKQEQAQIWVQQISEAISQGQEERRLSYLWRALLFAGLSVLGAIALHRILGFIWRYWLQRLIPKAANNPETGAQPKGIEVFLNLTLFLVRVGLWLGTIIYITDLFPLTRYWSQRIASILRMSLTSPAISLGEKSYSVINIIILISLFFGLVAIAGNFWRSSALSGASVAPKSTV
ncbi:hypothetical protein [Scytonema hofmannii]|uniref:hypothetical protein n=1 Tax=Scytonema hofmannii TaxID=34078 RepID=UPI00234EA920|nr:hypothetical protein [Scytonema hofmannii]